MPVMSECQNYDLWRNAGNLKFGLYYFWVFFFSYPKPYLRDSETGKAEMLLNDAILCLHAAHTIRTPKFAILWKLWKLCKFLVVILL